LDVISKLNKYAIFSQMPVSRNGKNSNKKLWDPDCDSDLHRNQMPCCYSETSHASKKFPNNLSTTFGVISKIHTMNEWGYGQFCSGTNFFKHSWICNIVSIATKI